ncbi:restriction endonuclease [Clostridium estertheticum]|uniref:restriction endonuclease n=1 Tax=Clostridium estertheticum TaxID=238834 RepID=UPI001C0CD10F|nr:restriction endonuclease [Clostridium estertheticum]MBU3176115.1 restriction endonuclease [Clostridium estertheticum]
MWEFNSAYYTKNYSNLNEWLDLIMRKENVYPFCKIPFYKWFDEYIENIGEESVESVKNLLRNLLLPINRKLDENNYEIYLSCLKSDDQCTKKMAENMGHNEMYKRIENGQDAWEGLTWVLELLPQKPYKAIQALGDYLLAQHSLPDDRIIGIEQSAEIISSRFIYFEQSMSILLGIKPVEFEWLIEELYKSMGYDTKWTKATRDGGKDVIAKINRIDGYEEVYIECKLYNTTELRLKDVESFGYRVLKDNVNRGVIFCTGYVNDKIKTMDKRIQIWGYEDINILLNSFLGSTWAENLGKLIKNKAQQYRK